jgi:hypothetical protein
MPRWSKVLRWVAPAALALAVVVPSISTVQAKEKEGAALRWATSWKAAVEQARDRNAVIFATFHKDN